MLLNYKGPSGATTPAFVDEDVARGCLLGRSLPHGVLLGYIDGEVRFANGTRRVERVEDLLTPGSLARLEEQSYSLANAICLEQAEGRIKSILTSAYHEVASLVRRILALHEVLAQGKIGLVLLDEQLAAAFQVGTRPTHRRFGALRNMLRPFRRGIRLLPLVLRTAAAAWKLRSREVIVATCNDAGSGINVRPLKAIVNELTKLGIPLVLITEVELQRLVPALDAVRTIKVDGDLPVWSTNPLALRLRETLVSCSVAPELEAPLERALESVWSKYVTRYDRICRVLNALDKFCEIRAVVSITETLPVSIVAGLWARARNIAWFGHFGATIGNCPDHQFFPATEHLAYGHQLADHIAFVRGSREGVHVVGSPAFDMHVGHDRDVDRALVEAAFPRVVGKKLLVVTSEAFPDPDTELVPILQAAVRVPGAHVILKLHPDDGLAAMREVAERAGVSDQIDIATTYPLGQLLSAADLLLSVMSTVIIEAAVIGTPSLVCDFSGKSQVLDFVQEGLCFGCYDPADIQTKVQALLFDPEVRRQARQKIRDNIQRFNGPNDGGSAARIARIIADRIGSGREKLRSRDGRSR